MKTQEEIQARIVELGNERDAWSKQAEEAILTKNWKTMAPHNADKCAIIAITLKWVLGEAEMSPRIVE